MSRRRHLGSLNRRTLAAAVASCFAANAYANPTGPTVTAGNATFQTLGNTLSISNVPGTIIQWQGFSIQANEITRFLQQSSSSAVLNRVTGGNMSQLLGQLLSNGRVFLINPSGIVVGQGAVIDVAALVATSLNLSDKDFLAGRYRFTGQEGARSIVNQGTIATPAGGFVYLVAPNVENHGIIRSPNGEVVLAAGKTVELVSAQSPQLRVEISAPEGEAVNLGDIISQAGRVGIYGASVRNSGRVSANSAVVGENGKIVFKATKDVTLADGSRVEATNSAGKGGSVEVQGDTVALTGDASIDVSGKTGGGSVLVGGDYRGANPDVQNASGTFIGAGTSIRADALESGDGGRVIVWSNEATRVHGSISAQGAGGGSGGFVETSSKGYLEVTNAPSLGAGGTWLLDPYDIEVVATLPADPHNDGAPTFTPTGEDSKVSAAAISGQLSGNVNVVLDTGGTGSPGTQAGNIDVNAGISSTGAGSLTLNAANNVSVNASISTGAGAFNTTAGGDMTVKSIVTSTGMNLSVAGALSVDGGTTQDAKLISLGGGQNITAQSVNVNAQNNHASTIENRGSGDQTITAAGGGMNLHALGGSGVAQIINSAPGASQALSMAGLLNVLGGTTTIPNLRNSGVFQNAGGLQHITASGILLQASSTNSGANTSSALISSTTGGADQLIDITGGGGSIRLNGGAGGSGNGASISSGRNQTIAGNADIFLISDAGGNASITTPLSVPVIPPTTPPTSVPAEQKISAHDITLKNGTGGINGAATILGGKQTIDASGDVELTAEAAVVTPGNLGGVRIGGNGGATDLTMTVGGNLALNGGSALDNAASIGSSGAGTAFANNINITAGGNVTLKAGAGSRAVARIGTGTLQAPAAGTISLTAQSGGIELNGNTGEAAAIRSAGTVALSAGTTISEIGNGFIEANSLSLSTTAGDALLGGANKVGSLSAGSYSADIAPLPVAGINGALDFHNMQDLNVTGVVSSTGPMTLNVEGKLSVSASGAQKLAAVHSQSGQTIDARSISVKTQDGDRATIQSDSGDQLIRVTNSTASPSTGIDISALGTTINQADIVSFGSSQTITVTDSDHIRITADPGMISGLTSSGPQTISITGSGANRIDIGAAGPGGYAQIGGRAQNITAGVGSQAGSINITGSASPLTTVGIISMADGITQTVSTSGTLSIQGGSAVNAISVNIETGILHHSSGLQTINARRIDLQGGLSGSGNTAMIHSTGGGLVSNAGDQVINVGDGGLHLTGGEVGVNNRAGITALANQTINVAGALEITGGASGGATNNTNTAFIQDTTVGRTQTINAGSLKLTSGASGVDNSAVVAASNQFITTTGDVSINGSSGGGNAPGPRIGGLGGPTTPPGPTNLTLNVGGDLVLKGGSATNNAATIGSVSSTPPQDNTITITAGGSVILDQGSGAGARIGASLLAPTPGAGTISITAQHGSIELRGNTQQTAIRSTGNVALTAATTISEGTLGFVEAGKLTLKSGGDATLGGNNKVATLSAPQVPATPVNLPGVGGALTFNNTTDLNVVDTVSSGGMMTVTVNGALNVNGGGAQDARLLSNGGQNITARSVNVTAQNNRLSTIQNFGGASQTVTATAGGMSVKALGGVGVAQIANNAAGASQTVSMTGLLDVLGGTSGGTVRGSGVFQQATTGTQRVTANGITLQASGTGTASSTSNAIILSQSGDQFVDAGGGDINMFGASAGTGNNALISALGNQEVRAHNINLENGTGGFNSVAAILGAHQTVTATGDVTLTGKSSSATGGQVSGVRIGGNGGATDLHLHADGNITLQGGTTDNNGVGIGSSAVGTAFDNTIDVSAGGNIVLNSGSAPSTGSRIGAGPNGNAHGSLKVSAGGEIQLNGTAQPTVIRTLDDVQISASRISEASNGFVVANTLSLNTTGDALMGGPNSVSTLSAPLVPLLPPAPPGASRPGVQGALTFNNTTDLNVTGIVSSASLMTLTVTGALNVSAGASSDARLISGGGQDISARSVNLAGQSNHLATIENVGGGNQTITATSDGMSLQAFAGSGVAQIINSAPGASQTLSVTGLLNVLGGTTTVGSRNSGVFQNASGLQHITAGNILLQASSTGSAAAPSGALISSTGGAADQLIDITGGSVTLNAGAAGSGNSAAISAGGNQTITGNANFFLTSAAGGNASITAPISRPTAPLTVLEQRVSAHDITLANGSGGINGNVAIVGGKQTIEATGNVKLNAEAGVVTPGSLAGIRIGGNGGATDLTMTVGGDLTLNGGTAQDNAASIGSSGAGTAFANNISITASGSVKLKAGSATGAVARIGTGTLQAPSAGSLSVTAQSGSIELDGSSGQAAAIRSAGNVTLSAGTTITESGNGFIEADLLKTASRNDTTLTGANAVKQFDGATTGGGSITLNNSGPLVVQAINAANAALTNAGSVAIRGGVTTSGSLTMNVAGALSIEANGAQDVNVTSGGGQSIHAQSLTMSAAGLSRAATLINDGGSQEIDLVGGNLELLATGEASSAVIGQMGGAPQRITVLDGDHVSLSATGLFGFASINASPSVPGGAQQISITGSGANALTLGAGTSIGGPDQTITAGAAGQLGSITVSGPGAFIQSSSGFGGGQTISTSGAFTISDSAQILNGTFGQQQIRARSLALADATLDSNGGQDIAAGSVSLLANLGQTSIVNSNGSQTIAVTGGNLDLSALGAGSSAVIGSGSLFDAQTITVSGGDRINVNGAGFQSFAGIQSSRGQTISITGAGLNAITVGSAGSLGSSNISAGAAQTLTAGVSGAESGSISITGGNTNGFSSSVFTISGTAGDQFVSTAGALSVTGGEASLQAQNRQSGLFQQGLGSQTVNAAAISIRGGASGSANGAFISSSSGSGNQFVTVVGDLTLEGRAGGNATLVGSPAGQQNVSAHDISLTNGIGGTNSVAGIFGAHQLISASGDVTLTARSSAAAPGSLPGVRIGGATGSATDLTLLVGNNLALSGGPADNNGAGIGSSAVGTPFVNNISITAGGNITLNGGSGALSGARIGYSTLNGPAGGNITIGAGSIVLHGNASAAAIRTTGDVQLDAGSVSEDSSGQIVASNLRLRTTGDADLGGPNAVANLSTVLQGPAGIPTPAFVGGFLKFNNVGDLAITSDVTSNGAMTLDVAGALAVSSSSTLQSARVNASGGQTIRARSLSVHAANGGNAALNNFGVAGQAVEIAGGGAGTGIDVSVAALGGGNATILSSAGVQTITATGADFINVNAASGVATINSQAAQTISIIGGGTNRINIGSTGATGISQVVARSQTVTAGSGSQAGGIDIVGSNAVGATTGLITFNLPGSAQTVGTSGVLRVTGGNAANPPLPVPPATTVPVSNAGIFNNSNGQQTVSAQRIELQGGLGGSGNSALISSTGGGVAANSGNQAITVGAGGIHMTGGAVGNSNRATIITSANQTIDSAGDIEVTGGASGGAVNFTNNASILANRADSVQTIHAGNILLTSGAAGVENSSSISAPTQRIYATGDVTLQGSGSTGVLNGVRLGGLGGNVPSNTDLELHVGGTLTLNGGDVANNGASIGSSLFTTTPLTSKITITTGGDVLMNAGAGAGARIGTSVLSPTLAAGDVSITAGGSIQLNGGATQAAAIRTASDVTLNAAAISEGPSNSFVLANQLTTTSTGDTTLGGANQVNSFSGTSSGGSVTLNNGGPLVIQAINAANAALITATSVHGSGPISTGTGFTVSVAEDSELNGLISGAGGLNKNGVGFLSLGAVNTYAGDTNVNAGVLALAAPDQTTTGNINIAAGATFRGSPGTYDNAGVIAGNGTLDVAATSFTNSGTLRPGGAGAIGTLTVAGNAVLNGTLDIEAQSAGAGGYDVLAVTGAATLGGGLNVTPISGYAPQAGDTLVPLTFASRSGTLSVSPTDWLSTYNPGNLTLGFSPLNRWTAATGGWDVASNWSLGHVPTNFETVLIDVPGSQFITLSRGAQAAARLTSNENFVISGGSLNLGGASTFNGSLSLLGGELTGAGGVTVNGAFVWTGGRLTGAGSFLTSAGTVSLLAPFPDDLFLGKSWTNQGTVNWINLLPRSIAGTGSLQNQGTMNVLGSSATIETAFSNSGTLNLFTGLDLRQSSGNAGTVNLDGAARLKVHGAYTNFGRMAGEGTVETDGGPLVNAGTLAPGGSGIGTFHVQGDFQQGATGVLEIDLGGTRVGQFDTLDVNGAATLGGTLFLRAANGYAPRDGDDFKLVTYKSRVGTFQFVLPPAGFTVDSDYARKFASFELER